VYWGYRLMSQSYQAHLWGPDIKGVLDEILGADWHTYEADSDKNADRTMVYVVCFTEDRHYLDFLVKFLVRAFTSRDPTGAPVRHSVGTLTVSFKVARCRRAPDVEPTHSNG
jgi:hypothetical protein